MENFDENPSWFTFIVDQACTLIRSKKTISPPSGFEGYLSRREAAALLGFASEFKVRQLEKAGRLHPARGIMGSAWYARAEVLALRDTIPRRDPEASPAEVVRWTDAALIVHLRGWAERSGAPPRPRTIVDLVADTGVPISRAERVYRLWLAHDLEPAAAAARAALAARDRKGLAPPPTPESARPAMPATAGPRAGKPSGERRSGERLERDLLLQRMRDPDPKVRAAAFEGLKRRRQPGG